MKHLDLFSGIGGFALAARWSGIQTVAFCEIDIFCQKVLAKNFPNIPIYPNIKELNGDEFIGVDIITGGYPCQPLKVQTITGKEFSLWPTPQAMDMLKARSPQAMKRQMNGARKNRKKVATMKDAAVYGLCWKKEAIRQGPGELSPQHLEWMMGYPIGWTEIKQ